MVSKPGAPATPLAARGRVLEAAARLLQATPLHQLTVAAISREAGVSRQTIYAHFEDSDDVAASVFITYAEKQFSPLRERILRRALDADSLEAVFWADIDAARAFFQEAAEDSGDVRAELADFILGSQRMRDYEQAIWLPVLTRFDDANLLRSDVDLPAVARWLSYQQALLVAHPDAQGDEAHVRRQVRRFVIEPVLG